LLGRRGRGNFVLMIEKMGMRGEKATVSGGVAAWSIARRCRIARILRRMTAE
jgi:hypothetical protein